VFWHLKWQWWGDFSGMFHKKSENICTCDQNTYKSRIILRTCHRWFGCINFFWTHCPVLSEWAEESRSAWKLGHVSILPVKSQWTMNISVNSFPDRKVLSTTSNNLSRSLWQFPCLIAAEHYVSYCSRGKTNFGSNLGEKRSQNPWKFHKNLFRGRIESIKSKKHAQGFFLLHVDFRNMPIYGKIHIRPAFNVAISSNLR